MDQAIVIMGAGIAGMAAAKMLTQRGRNVLLVDKSFGPAAQSGHLHVLLSRGQQLLQQQFPAVYRKVCDACPEVNWGNETYWRSPAGPLPKRLLDVSTRLLSRAYLDQLLVEDLRRTPNCELVEGTIKTLSLSGDRTRLESITLSDGRKIACEIFVDCLGRGSRSKQFLESQFSSAVQTDEIRTALRYYSFDARRRSPGEFKQAYFQIDPQTERFGGVISPIEGDRMIATFISVDKEFEIDGNPFHLIDDEVFQNFVSQIEFEPGHRAFGQLHNRRHRYEKYRDLPSNLFLIGDSVCQFNPVFGQGMTVALESAAMLDQFIGSGERGQRRSLEFQKRLAKSIRFQWMISTMDPYRPGAARNWSQRITRTLMHRVMRNCQTDSRTHQSLINALHMLESPLKLIKLRNLL